MKMIKVKLIVASMLLFFLTTITYAQIVNPNADMSNVASWDTWIADADAIAALVQAPSATTNEIEIQELIALQRRRDADTIKTVNYWNAVAPTYRWVETKTTAYSNMPLGPAVFRPIALLNVGMYDAVVTTWKAKEATGNLPSPSEVNGDLQALLPNRGTSSFPSEHAAVAVAASEILSFLKPDLADSFRAKAEEAMQSRLMAGMNTQSDIEAGKMIGMAVAEQIIAYAKTDGSDAPWDYVKPEGSLYTVEKPIFSVTGSWKTMAIENGAQFRVPAPPAYDSAEVQAQLDEIKAVDMTAAPVMFQVTRWARFPAGYPFWFDLSHKLLFEQRQSDNTPYVALIHASMGVAVYDAVVGCFDSKYAYVYARPSHVDTSITPLIPIPPHPSYPSAHSCITNSMAYTFSHFFPEHKEEAMNHAASAGQSRILGGIHYQMDNTTGLELGRQVAGVVIDTISQMTGN